MNTSDLHANILRLGSADGGEREAARAALERHTTATNVPTISAIVRGLIATLEHRAMMCNDTPAAASLAALMAGAVADVSTAASPLTAGGVALTALVTAEDYDNLQSIARYLPAQDGETNTRSHALRFALLLARLVVASVEG